MKRKIFSNFLVFVFTAGILMNSFTYTARAQQPNDPDTLNFDGVTYYNVHSNNFSDNEMQFYMDIMTARRSELGGYSIAECWTMTASALHWHDLSCQDRYNLSKGALDFWVQYGIETAEWGPKFSNGVGSDRFSQPFWERDHYIRALHSAKDFIHRL